MADKVLHKSIGKRVKIMRSKLGLTQKDVAEHLGLTQTHMCNLENGYCGFSVDNLVKLKALFKCNFDDFFTDFAGVAKTDTELNCEQKISLNSEDLDKLLKIISIMKS